MKESIKRRYISLVDFLGKTLGPHYEIVLQETDGENTGIIAIANGEISGRKVGNPLTSVALKMMMKRQYEYSDYALNYVGVLDNGKIVRSSTYFIKDDGKLVGMLCINFDSSKYQEIGDELLHLIHPDQFLTSNELLSNRGYFKPRPTQALDTPLEHFQADTTALMEEIMENAIATLNVPLSELPPSGRTAFIATLYEHGMFQLKDSVNFVAEKLGCAPVSVYRYLSKAKENMKED